MLFSSNATLFGNSTCALGKRKAFCIRDKGKVPPAHQPPHFPLYQRYTSLELPRIQELQFKHQFPIRQRLWFGFLRAPRGKLKAFL
jgi:hypothetical protein